MRKSLQFGMLLCFLFIIVACSSEKVSDVDGSDSGDSKNSTETITLLATTHTPAEDDLSLAFDAYLDEIEERSNGQVKFERYYNGALAGGTDVIDAVTSGIADIAVTIIPWQSGRLNLNSVTTNPGIYDNSWVAIKALNELEKNNPELSEELANLNLVNVANFSGLPNYIITKNPVKTIEDFKGQQLITLSPPEVTIAQELGMTPVGMAITDAYDAISKGVADGITLNIGATMDFGIAEFTKYAWKGQVGTFPGMFTMNKDVFESLPSDVQEIILDVKENSFADLFYKISFAPIYDLEEEFLKDGGTIVEPTAEDAEHLNSIIENKIWKPWIEEKNNEGLPGDILTQLKELSQKYEKEFPY